MHLGLNLLLSLLRSKLHLRLRWRTTLSLTWTQHLRHWDWRLIASRTSPCGQHHWCHRSGLVAEQGGLGLRCLGKSLRALCVAKRQGRFAWSQLLA